MVKLKNFEVLILQDDNAVPEHLDPQAGVKEATVTRYIEIKEDQQFKIELTVDPDFDYDEFDSLCIEIYFDGEYVMGRMLSKDHYKQGTVFSYTISEQFFFNETTTRLPMAGEDAHQLQRQYRNQGILKVRLSRVSGYSTMQDPKERQEKAKKLEASYPKSVVKEKGSTSKASYTRTERSGPQSVFITTNEEDPMASFILKYRTIEALQDQLVVKVPIIEYPEETFTDDDIRAENERLRAEIEELRTKVKQEAADDHRNTRQQKRKYLEIAGEAKVDLLEERRAHGRGPTAQDEVIELDE